MNYRLLLTLALFILCCGSLLAQSYDLQIGTDTYTDFTDDYVLNNDTMAQAYGLGVPFNMRSYDRSFDYSTEPFAVARDGYVYVADSLYIWYMDVFGGAYGVRDSTSAISVAIDLLPTGKKILKFQWKNMALVGNSADDYVNFQVSMSEQDNSVEVHVGPNHITGTAAFGGKPSPHIGMYLSDRNISNTTFYHTLSLVGDPANPSLNLELWKVSLDSAPAEGMIYRFVPKKPSGAGVEAPAVASGIAFHPNPAAGSTQLTLPEGLAHSGATLRIYDMLGREALVMNDVTNGSAIAAGQLAPGMYYGVVNSGTRPYNTGMLIVR